MTVNIYVFWRPSADPPSPWTRLTRQGRYVRFTDLVAAHLGQVGAANHYHGNAMSSVWIGNCGAPWRVYTDDGPWNEMGDHAHGAPGSWSISAANNDPAWYGLDLIYMDLTVWETYEKRFPDGAIVLSSEALSDPGFMERFTAADGKYIVNTNPETTGGITETKYHYCQGTTAYGSGTAAAASSNGTDCCNNTSHPHGIAAWSDGRTNEPRNLTTRLYEILALTVSAKIGTVVFCDGTPGANWEVQSSWSDANLKSGNSNPTLSGADSHDQSISGNTGGSGLTNNRGSFYSQGGGFRTDANHVHPFSATLAAESHVPLSSLLVPYKLKADLYHPCVQRAARIIGPIY